MPVSLPVRIYHFSVKVYTNFLFVEQRLLKIGNKFLGKSYLFLFHILNHLFLFSTTDRRHTGAQLVNWKQTNTHCIIMNLMMTGSLEALRRRQMDADEPVDVFTAGEHHMTTFSI